MITLFVNKFESNDPERRVEYETCLEKNKENPLIDKIVLIKSNDRPSYAQAFNLMNDDSINILANSDIYFNETLHFVKLITKREFWCLTRWEELDGQIMFFSHRHPGVQPRYSQDVWISNGQPQIPDASFQMGVPGCDNKIAWLAWSAGYQLRNPSYSIQAIHLHRKDWRDPRRDVDKLKPPYKWVTPETLRR